MKLDRQLACHARQENMQVLRVRGTALSAAKVQCPLFSQRLALNAKQVRMQSESAILNA